jgi:hypothetical protein
LYELVTGRRPFPGKTREDVFKSIVHDEPAAPRSARSDVDHSLQAVILRCLRKDPKDRYTSAAALAQDLKNWRAGEPTSAWPLSGRARILRRVRRHPVLVSTAASALVGTMLLIGALGMRAQDPDAPIEYVRSDEPTADQLQIINDELAIGRTADLMDTNSLPRWFHRIVGVTGIRKHPIEAGTFHVSTMDRSLVELLPHTPPRGYRMQIDVRPDLLLPCGQAGLFISGKFRETPDRSEYWYAKVYVTQEPITGEYLVNFGLERFLPETESGSPSLCSEKLLFRQTAAAARNEAGEVPWVSLALEVTPEKIVASCDDKHVYELTSENLASECRSLLRNKPLFDDDFGGLSTTDGSIGLYLNIAGASYRKAVEIPLD